MIGNLAKLPNHLHPVTCRVWCCLQGRWGASESWKGTWVFGMGDAVLQVWEERRKEQHKDRRNWPISSTFLFFLGFSLCNQKSGTWSPKPASLPPDIANEMDRPSSPSREIDTQLPLHWLKQNSLSHSYSNSYDYFLLFSTHWSKPLSLIKTSKLYSHKSDWA